MTEALIKIFYSVYDVMEVIIRYNVPLWIQPYLERNNKGVVMKSLGYYVVLKQQTIEELRTVIIMKRTKELARIQYGEREITVMLNMNEFDKSDSRIVLHLIHDTLHKP